MTFTPPIEGNNLPQNEQQATTWKARVKSALKTVFSPTPSEQQLAQYSGELGLLQMTRPSVLDARQGYIPTQQECGTLSDYFRLAWKVYAGALSKGLLQEG